MSVLDPVCELVLDPVCLNILGQPTTRTLSKSITEVHIDNVYHSALINLLSYLLEK